MPGLSVAFFVFLFVEFAGVFELFMEAFLKVFCGSPLVCQVFILSFELGGFPPEFLTGGGGVVVEYFSFRYFGCELPKHFLILHQRQQIQQVIRISISLIPCYRPLLAQFTHSECIIQILEMGNEQKKTNHSELRDYERFGSVAIKHQQIKNKRENYSISTMNFTKSLDSQKTYKSWEQQINRVNDSEAQEIILLPLEKRFERVGFCGSSGIVHIKYQNFPYILESEIKNRKKMKRLFSEPEIWYLLYNMIRAAYKFQKINKKIGDVNPHNIVINDDGQIKVISTCSLPEQSDNFQKVVEDPTQKVFLAPQQLNAEYISKGEYPPGVNPCKAEVFSIGLTILSAGVLQDCYCLYRLPSEIDEIKINEKLRRLKQKYSAYFFSILCSMLIFPPNERKKASDIYTQLCQYEDEILELQPFSTNKGNSRIKQHSQINNGYQFIYDQYQERSGDKRVEKGKNFRV